MPEAHARRPASDERKAVPVWQPRLGGGEVQIEGMWWLSYDWHRKGYRPHVRVGSLVLARSDEVGNRREAKIATIKLARESLEKERARIDRVLAALDTIRDEPERPIARKEGRRP